jgi:hypothetical protein
MRNDMSLDISAASYWIFAAIKFLPVLSCPACQREGQAVSCQLGRETRDSLKTACVPDRAASAVHTTTTCIHHKRSSGCCAGALDHSVQSVRSAGPQRRFPSGSRAPDRPLIGSSFIILFWLSERCSDKRRRFREVIATALLHL